MNAQRTRAKIMGAAVGVVLAVSMTASMMLIPTQDAQAVPSYSQLAQSKARHSNLKQQLSGVSSDLAQQIIDLDDLTNNQIPAAEKAADRAAESRLKAAQKDKADLEQKIKETGEDYDDAHAAVAQVARDSFHGSVASDTMSMVTGAKSTDDFIESMQSESAVTRSENAAANDAATEKNTSMNRKQRLDAIEQQIASLKNQADADAASAQKAAADAQEKTKTLNALRDKGTAQREALEQRQSQLKSATAKEAAQVVILQSQIDSYNKQLAAQAAKQNAAQKIAANSGSQASSSSNSSSRPSSGGSSSSSSHSSSSSSNHGSASGMNYSVPGNCPQGSTYCYGHSTGNVGNAYPWSQCTWWAYIRRGQLSLPVGSYLGNGQDWGWKARALGYLVNNTPHVGAAISFKAGQLGSSPIYGHVAIVERVNSNGSILISESGSRNQGRVTYRTVYNPGLYTYVHY